MNHEDKMHQNNGVVRHFAEIAAICCETTGGQIATSVRHARETKIAEGVGTLFPTCIRVAVASALSEPSHLPLLTHSSGRHPSGAL